MAHQYAAIAFTDTVRQMQVEHGSRAVPHRQKSAFQVFAISRHTDDAGIDQRKYAQQSAVAAQRTPAKPGHATEETGQDVKRQDQPNRWPRYPSKSPRSLGGVKHGALNEI